MYRCKDCGRKIVNLRKVEEKHGMVGRPYETFYLCPYCDSTNYEKMKPNYCKCCGARMYKQVDYCCPACKKRGELMWATQEQRKKAWLEHPLYKAIKEVDEYNRVNGTQLSYGQYFAVKSDKN